MMVYTKLYNTNIMRIHLTQKTKSMRYLVRPNYIELHTYREYTARIITITNVLLIGKHKWLDYRIGRNK